LHQAIEKLVKAYALYFGLQKEEELRKIGHLPVKAYLELIEKPWITKITDLFRLNIKVDISKSKQLLENLIKFEKNNKRQEVLQLDKSIPIFLQLYKNIVEILNKKFSERETKGLIEMFKFYRDIENYCRVMFGFGFLLLPLSAIISVYYVPSKYPKERRELQINFDNLEAIKNMERITELFQDNVDRLKSLIEQERKGQSLIK